MNNDDTIEKKIIHIDMDCFYAAIEIRDQPHLKNKPVAIGSPSHERGVICTSNYIARQYGVHSALATAYAERLCPELILLPVHMKKYQAVAQSIRKIFSAFTDLIEPLSLDEAFLDVTNTPHFKGSATLLAKEIKKQIFKKEHLTASAGIASNKLLAKIASDWKKPDGLFVITPKDAPDFMKTLPVKKLFGVGKITNKKLSSLGIKTCHDLQKWPIEKLLHHFNTFGKTLYSLCRGIDEREVQPHRKRKSLSVEKTFPKDLTPTQSQQEIDHLYDRLCSRLDNKELPGIKKQYVKIKFSDFYSTTVECLSTSLSKSRFHSLLEQGMKRQKQPIRLIGLGVKFEDSFENQQITF